MGVIVKVPGDEDQDGNQKYRPGIVIKSYPSHLELQLLTTVENKKHNYHSLTINNQKQYIRPIYYRTLPWDQIMSKWIINEQEIFLSPNNPLFMKIAENKVKLLNDNYQLEHKISHQREKVKDKALEIEPNYEYE